MFSDTDTNLLTTDPRNPLKITSPKNTNHYYSSTTQPKLHELPINNTLQWKQQVDTYIHTHTHNHHNNDTDGMLSATERVNQQYTVGHKFVKQYLHHYQEWQNQLLYHTLHTKQPNHNQQYAENESHMNQSNILYVDHELDDDDSDSDEDEDEDDQQLPESHAKENLIKTPPSPGLFYQPTPIYYHHTSSSHHSHPSHRHHHHHPTSTRQTSTSTPTPPAHHRNHHKRFGSTVTYFPLYMKDKDLSSNQQNSSIHNTDTEASPDNDHIQAPLVAPSSPITHTHTDDNLLLSPKHKSKHTTLHPTTLLPLYQQRLRHNELIEHHTTRMSNARVQDILLHDKQLAYIVQKSTTSPTHDTHHHSGGKHSKHRHSNKYQVYQLPPSERITPTHIETLEHLIKQMTQKHITLHSKLPSMSRKQRMTTISLLLREGLIQEKNSKILTYMRKKYRENVREEEKKRRYVEAGVKVNDWDFYDDEGVKVGVGDVIRISYEKKTNE